MIFWYGSLTSTEQIFALIAIAATTFLFLQTGMLLLGLGLHSGDGDTADFADHDHDGLDGQLEMGSLIEVEADLPDMDLNLDFAEDSDISGVTETLLDIEAEINDSSNSSVHGNLASSLRQSSPDTGLSNEPGLHLLTLRGLVAFFALFGWSGLVALQAKLNIISVITIATLAGALACYTVAKLLQIFMKLQDSGNLQLENAIGLTGTVYIRVPAKYSGVGKVNLTLQERYIELEAITPEETDILPGQSIIVSDLKDTDTIIVHRITP